MTLHYDLQALFDLPIFAFEDADVILAGELVDLEDAFDDLPPPPLLRELPMLDDEIIW